MTEFDAAVVDHMLAGRMSIPAVACFCAAVLTVAFRRHGERHVVVIAHRTGQPVIEKGYFSDSLDGDHGGSGPFDWKLEEAITRAKRFAEDHRIAQIVVRAKVA